MMNFWSTSKVAHAALSTTTSSVTVSQYEIETLFPNHLYVTALHPYRIKASCEHSSCGRRYAFMAFVIIHRCHRVSEVSMIGVSSMVANEKPMTVYTALQ